MGQDYRGLCDSEPIFRVNYLNELTQKLHNEQFVSDSRTDSGRKGFTRERKLTFVHLILLLVQGLSRSIQRELNSFYQKLQDSDLPLQYVVKSSFTKARSKLKHTAFITLNEDGTRVFYRDAPYLKWKGHRLLAVDGSTAVLPRSSDIMAEFGSTGFGCRADSPRTVARMSVLYDVLNLTVIDGQLDRYDVSERKLALQHLSRICSGQDIVLFDRGYPGFKFIHTLHKAGINYVIRLTERWWKEARKMIADNESDKQVTFKTKEGNAFICRLIAIEQKDGTTQILCTNLLDTQKYESEAFKDLYHKRWNIEEGYKLFKSRAQLESFSGKTALSVRQDFFARLFMMTSAAVLAFPVEERLKKEQAQTANRHRYKVNRTNTLAIVKHHLHVIVIKRIVIPCLRAIDNVLIKTKEIIRPGRSFPRKHIKKKPPNSNYKHL